MTTYTEVIFNELQGVGGAIGEIVLNRSQVLNSINLSMVHAIYHQLQTWATSNAIKAVVIRAVEGRAFCAGGDIRQTYEQAKSQDIKAINFFRDEYQLNRLIYHFPKPYIAFLNGITMGGGVGISIHGSHRIATEHLMFAMPETGIGFFPDVGGTYFLPRLPGQLGYYLGLTGARLQSDDCVALGIAQHKVAAQSLPALLKELINQPFKHEAKTSVSEIIEQFSTPTQTSPLLQEKEEIDNCFSGKTMEAIMQALQNAKHTICKESLTTLSKKSPTSLKVTLRALNEGRYLEFDACMKQEFRLASHFLESRDFQEGIRAAIIDKDQNPHWQPETLDKVKEPDIAKFFAPLAEELA